MFISLCLQCIMIVFIVGFWCTSHFTIKSYCLSWERGGAFGPKEAPRILGGEIGPELSASDCFLGKGLFGFHCAAFWGQLLSLTLLQLGRWN